MAVKVDFEFEKVGTLRDFQDDYEFIQADTEIEDTLGSIGIRPDHECYDLAYGYLLVPADEIEQGSIETVFTTSSPELGSPVYKIIAEW